MVDRLWVPLTHRFVARNRNWAMSVSPFTASSVANSVAVSTPLRNGLSMVVMDCSSLVCQLCWCQDDGGASGTTCAAGRGGTGLGTDGRPPEGDGIADRGRKQRHQLRVGARAEGTVDEGEREPQSDEDGQGEDLPVVEP